MRLAILFRDRDAKQPVAGSDVEHAQRLRGSPPTRPASNWAGICMSGAIARANSTQIGLSWETVPSSETAVPPRRTAAVSC